MNSPDSNLPRAASSDCLTQRIAENSAGQQTDLVQWIFERITLPENPRILELCCGTGAQTQRLVQLAGTQGKVTALDLSSTALEAMLARLSPEQRARVQALQGGLDLVSEVVLAADPGPSFDLIFCAYGLYYSSDAVQTLRTVKSWLRPGGEIIIVGPFGPNNGALFELLEANGVPIPEYVRYTSQDFMPAAVVPWAGCNFRTVELSTLNNPVRWETPAKILNYWEHSTFYVAERRAAVEQALATFFEREAVFINEKWIMMARMTHARG